MDYQQGFKRIRPAKTKIEACKIKLHLVRNVVINVFRTKILIMLRTFLAFMLLSCTASAQKNYLITSKADTLYGKIRILSYDLIDRVQIETDKKKEMYTALQVLTVEIDSQVYKPIQYDRKVMLMKLLKPGYMSLYAFRLPDKNFYDGRFLVRLDGTSIEVPNIGFKKILGTFLEDCETVANQVKNGDLVKKELDKIIDDYNICIAEVKNNVRPPVVTEPVQAQNEKTIAIESLINKVEAEDFSTKKDALDLLRDIQTKASKNETIPNYLSEGLKSYLSNVPSITVDLENLLELLKK